jgi:pyruvate,water dikinase
VVALDDLSNSSVDVVGGKGANLAALTAAGLPVPAGFTVTTMAFERFLAACPRADTLLDDLQRVPPDDHEALADAGRRLRFHLGAAAVPEVVRDGIVAAWRRAGTQHLYAVRSSAVSEDSAGASFAGQHDSFLNLSGEQELLARIRSCWRSLYTDRAIGYRARHGIDQRRPGFAVVVQRMADADVSGVMFTADPVTGHRQSIVVNAAYGLGESVVSGLVNPDLYRVTADGAVHVALGDKQLEILPAVPSGLARAEVPAARRSAQALPGAAVTELAELGRRVQRHLGAPQDIEWAYAGGRFTILQARPITSLFPTPSAPGDGRLHVYFSFGHQQMMTDAMKPLALSVLRTFFPFGSRDATGESTHLVQAGNRLFFDYTEPLHGRLSRRLLAHAAGSMDRRVGESLLDIARRPEFRAGHRRDLVRDWRLNRFVLGLLGRIVADLCWADMASRQARVVAFSDRLVEDSRSEVGRTHGAQRIERIRHELETWPLQMFLRLTVPQVSALRARGLVQGLARRWLGRDVDMAALDKSLPGNVTTEMAFALADLADLARTSPEVLGVLESPPEPFSLSVLDDLDGGPQLRAALEQFLDRYGMRGPGEVDITRPRWGERPSQLFGAILANCRQGPPGHHRVRFADAEREAADAVDALLSAARATPLGPVKALALRRLVTVYRTLMGLRENQKFLSVRLFETYRRALREEADGLVERGVLRSTDDVDYLHLDELRRLLEGDVPADLRSVLRARREEYAASLRLTPPRLFTSDGEIVSGSHGVVHREGALLGCPVSGGVAQGRARVVLRPDQADLRHGDILVAPFTDPAWTPLFSAVQGIVLEIGGMMTHGAVVAREMGIPTVVGVDNATRLIADGATIRVDGSSGLVDAIPA